MLSIDGLITGLDSTRIVDGLMNIQQRQIDVLNGRRSVLMGKKAAFSGIESRLLAFRGALNRLSSIQRSALNAKSVESSHDTLVRAAASDTAIPGTYQLRVNQLAMAHQIASNGFASEDATLGTGNIVVQSADGVTTTLELDDNNNTLRGLANQINGSNLGMTASIINDGSASEPFRLLIASKQTGTESAFTISTTLTGGGAIEFDQVVQQATNASISFGSGDGAITITSGSNRMDNVIDGVTLNLVGAQPETLVTLNVRNDSEAGVNAVKEFVDAYNDLVKYVNQQTAFNTATNVGGPLLGERSIGSIRDEIQLTMIGVVPGLAPQLNRLTSLGISVQNNGTLSLNESRLRDILEGRVEGVSAGQAARLLALGADSTNSKINFVVGSSKTFEGTVQVKITQAARQASVIAANSIAGPITIDETNDSLAIVVDGVTSGQLNLAHGEYSPEQLATQLQAVINRDASLGNRDVKVTLAEGRLTITSETFGSTSEVKLLSGNAWNALGFTGTEADQGLDVAGHFIVNGEQEEATGRGTLLVASENNRFTADLQLRVRLEAHELGEEPEATLTITRGIASRLDQLIGKLTDIEKGRVRTINQRFEQIDESIQASIDRLNKQFESQRERLLKEFAALETAVNRLQGTSNFLATQLNNLIQLK